MDTIEAAENYSSWGSEPATHISAVRRVCHFIHDNLDETINLDVLAKVAYISPFHLHRIFNRLLGETLQAYVRRLRLERSAYELKICDKAIIAIALDAGYKAHETFTRAFRKRFGINPSVYRQKYGLKEKTEAFDEHEHSRWIDPNEVKIKKLGEMRVAYLRITGPYANCLAPDVPNSPWQLLLKALHMRKAGLKNPKFLGICHDDPQITDKGHIRFDAAILIPPEIEGDSLIRIGHTEAGHYAVAKHRGSFQQLDESYSFMMQRWILSSNYRLRNVPPFEIYFNGVGQGDDGIHLYIPMEPKGRKI